MDDNLIKSWLDIGPQYINFALKFTRSPRTAFAPYAAKPNVEKDPFTFMLAGVGLAYLIILVVRPPVERDPSILVHFFRHAEVKSLPPIVLLFLILVTILGHVFARITMKLFDQVDHAQSKIPSPHLGGTLEDSLNAALGFSAVFVPWVVFVWSVGMWTFSIHPTASGAGTSLLIVAFLLIYLPLSLAAVHPNTSFIQALLSLCAAMMLPTLAITLLD